MTKLRPFQLEGVQAIHSFRGRCLLADEQGLGKTVQSLYWAHKLPKRRPVVIVCPASVKYTWQSEAHLHFNLRAEVIEGKYRKGKRLPKAEILIINYDILSSWVKPLRKLGPQIVILDEAHFIKNLHAQRTRASIKLAKKAFSVLALSGTPFTNRPIELWPVLKAVNPAIFPSREKFAWKYCKPRWTPWGWKYDGACNTKKLNRTLRRTCMIRRLKKDVLSEIPDMQHKMITLRLTGKALVEYNKAEDDFIAWLSSKSPARAEKAKRAPNLTKVGYLLRAIAEMKMAQGIQWIKDFFEANPGEKLVVFTMHTEVIEQLKHAFPQALIVNGSVTGKKRHETVRLFQNGKHHNLLLGNWKAAGVGLTLTAAAYAAAFDFPWTPGDMAQGRDRIHRIGQTRQTFFYYLVAQGTVEEKLIGKLRKKANVLNAVLNGGDLEDDFDIFAELLSIIKKGRNKHEQRNYQ